jgi:hypothetical protein
MKKTTKLSNSATQKSAVFAQCKELGGNYLRGSTAVSDLLKLCAINAAEKLISEHDAGDILQSFLSGAGPMQESTTKKLRSNILVMIRAGALPKVGFIGTIAKAEKMHAERQKSKNNKPAQWTETLLGIAREQLKHETRAISDTQIREKLQAPRSRLSGAEKPAAGVRMAKQVKNLSPADFKILVQAVHARLGLDDGPHEDENENPIEAMIAAVGNGKPLLTTADVPVLNLETKKRRRK